jgi:hypothetical protein
MFPWIMSPSWGPALKMEAARLDVSFAFDVSQVSSSGSSINMKPLAHLIRIIRAKNSNFGSDRENSRGSAKLATGWTAEVSHSTRKQELCSFHTPLWPTEKQESSLRG